jgi:hypothetical protein
MPSEHPPTKKPAMSLLARCMLIAGGLVTIGMGVEYLHRGVFSFTNLGYRQTMFSGGVIGSGIVLMLFAFLPSGDWVYRRITTKRNFKLVNHTRHTHTHKSETDTLER